MFYELLQNLQLSTYVEVFFHLFTEKFRTNCVIECKRVSYVDKQIDNWLRCSQATFSN